MCYEKDATVAFMPLYPMLVRLLGGMMVHNYIMVALVLSTLFTIIDVIMLYELFRAGSCHTLDCDDGLPDLDESLGIWNDKRSPA